MANVEDGRRALLEHLGAAGRAPVADVIADLAYRRVGESPLVPLAVMAARPDEFREPLLAELALTPAELAAREREAPDGDHAYFLFHFALYFLAAWQEPRAFPLIVAFLVADPKAVDETLGDALADEGPAILARTYDGSSLDPLKAIIEDRSAPTLLRSVCARSLHAMVELGRLDRRATIAYFDAYAAAIGPDEDPEFLGIFAGDLCAFRDPRLRVIVERWLRQKMVQPMLFSGRDLEQFDSAPGAVEIEMLTRSKQFDSLIDSICDWPWFLGTTEDPLDVEPRDGLSMRWSQEPFVRGAPKIGRNEPCPCGSGKKYKKCCLRDE